MTEQPKAIQQEQITNRPVAQDGAKAALIVLTLFFLLKLGTGLFQDYQRVKEMGVLFDTHPEIPGDGIRPHLEPLNVFIQAIFITFFVGLFALPGGMIGSSIFKRLTNTWKVVLLGGLIGASLGVFLGYYLLSLYLWWRIVGT